MNNFHKLNLFNGVKQDFVIGLTINLLPISISVIYNSLTLKILRILGGFCVILYATEIYIVFTEDIICILTVIVFIQLTQTLFISIVKVYVGVSIISIKNVYRSLNVVYVVLLFRIGLILCMELIGLMGALDQLFDVINHINELRRTINDNKKKSFS